MKHATEFAQVETHPLMQQRVDVLRVLIIRTQAARETFARLAGLVMPEKKVRYQVKTVGKAYHIVELTTDKVRGFRFSYKEAVNFAQTLEARADRNKTTVPGELK